MRATKWFGGWKQGGGSLRVSARFCGVEDDTLPVECGLSISQGRVLLKVGVGC
jgi:hypothetical protein